MTDSRTGRTAFRSIAARTALATAAAIAASWALNYALLLFAEGISAFGRSMVTATVLPVLLAGPLVAFGLWQREKLRRARRAGQRGAAYDPATGFVGAQLFSDAIRDRRRPAGKGKGAGSGALLLVDLDELKLINARFGAEWSSSALAIVSDAVRRSVRGSDLVGRIETGELAIFLADADEREAGDVARRIADAVAAVYFAPGGIERSIGLRIAGVVFDHELRFDEMLRHAGRQLVDDDAQSRPTTIRLQTLPPDPSP